MIAGLGHVNESIRTGRFRLVSAKARSHVSPVAIRRALHADRWVPRYRAAIQRVLNRQVRQVARESLVTIPEPERHVTQWAEELAREKKRWVYAIVIEGYELAGLEVERLSEPKSAGDLRGKADPIPIPVASVELGREVGGEFLLRGDFDSIDRWVDTTSLGEAQTSAKKLERIWKDAAASRDPVTGAAWTSDQIGKQILRRGLADNVARADMLAKTGAIWSVNEGAQQRYRAAGVKAEQWLTTKDDARCPYCKGMDGVVVRTGDPFWPAGSEYGNPAKPNQSLKLPYEVQHPPLHPRCRCSLVPVIQAGEVVAPTPTIRKPRRGVARKPKPKPRAPIVRRDTRPRDTRINNRKWIDGLKPEEENAVKDWVGFSTDIRDIQSGRQKGTKKLQATNRAFISAMQKSPRNAQPVWRGLSDLKPGAFRQFQTGKTIQLKAFASSSTSKKEALEFAEGSRRNVLLHFRKQTHGTNLRGFGEDEVVLHKGRGFRVVKRFYTTREKGAVDYLLNIVLEEI